MRELLIGCGVSREKKLRLPSGDTGWDDLVTLDADPGVDPDVVHDLDELPYPFPDSEFDEIHAYEVLEHCGRQGDWRFFLDQFAELWRIVKPNGVLFGTCPLPNSVWAWGDPSHTRIISLQSFSFLSQKQYEADVGRTPMSDFRPYYKADWELVWSQVAGETQLFALKAVKP